MMAASWFINNFTQRYAMVFHRIWFSSYNKHVYNFYFSFTTLPMSFKRGMIQKCPCLKAKWCLSLTRKINKATANGGMWMLMAWKVMYPQPTSCQWADSVKIYLLFYFRPRNYMFQLPTLKIGYCIYIILLNVIQKVRYCSYAMFTELYVRYSYTILLWPCLNAANLPIYTQSPKLTDCVKPNW